MIPLDGLKVFAAALQVTENIAYYVPKNVNADQLCSLAGPGGVVEIEQVADKTHTRFKCKTFLLMFQAGFQFQNVLNGKVKTVTAYYGELVKKKQTRYHQFV